MLVISSPFKTCSKFPFFLVSLKVLQFNSRQRLFPQFRPLCATALRPDVQLLRKLRHLLLLLLQWPAAAAAVSTADQWMEELRAKYDIGRMTKMMKKSRKVAKIWTS